MTTRDISAHLKSVYGVDASAEMISHMTDRILPIAKEWQNRPLEKKYAVVFMDAASCMRLSGQVDSFNFLQESEPFSHRLSWCLRQTSVKHLVR